MSNDLTIKPVYNVGDKLYRFGITDSCDTGSYSIRIVEYTVTDISLSFNEEFYLYTLNPADIMDGYESVSIDYIRRFGFFNSKYSLHRGILAAIRVRVMIHKNKMKSELSQMESYETLSKEVENFSPSDLDQFIKGIR